MPFPLPAQKDTLKDSLRDKTIEAARHHKASWIELGQYLHTVFKDKHYRDWGFLSFEAYCVKELSIKQTTAAKLLKSYFFLEKEEPRLRETLFSGEASPKTLPSYEAVNLLRLAKTNKNFTEDDYAELKEAVVEAGKEPKELRQQMKKILSEKAETDPRETRLKTRNTLLKKLVSILSSAKREFQGEKLLPGSLLREMEELARKLEAQIE